MKTNIYGDFKICVRVLVNEMKKMHSFLRIAFRNVKVSDYGVFSGPYFLAFGLRTEIYGVRVLTRF